MKTIRYGSFETNSSSTHAIVVPKVVNEDNYSLYDGLDHDYGFGRQECRLVEHWDEKLAYVYMVLKGNKEWSESEDSYRPDHITTQEEVDNFKIRVCNIWEALTKKVKDYYKSNPTPEHIFKYIDEDREDGDITGEDGFHIIMARYGNYVDHLNGLDDTDFLDKIKTDDEFLKRLLFNSGSYITICGDEYRGYNIKTIGFEYDYDEHYYINKKGERPPKEWFKKDGRIKQKYWDKYFEEYNIDAGGFWDKLKEYEKDNDVFLKGN